MRGAVLEIGGAEPPREIRVAEMQTTVRRHGAVLAVVAGAVDVRRTLARGPAPFGDHAQADDLRADRRAGRRADRGAARAGRRRAQLGLPLHLGARLVVLRLRPAGHGIHRRGGRVRRVAGRPDPRARRRRRRAAQHHVPGRRVLRPDRGGARPLGGLPRLQPGADRQRRGDPAAARHLRRGARQHLLRRRARGCRCSHAGWTTIRELLDWLVRPLGPAGGGHLGDPRRPEGLHLRPVDDLGGLRPERSGWRGDTGRPAPLAAVDHRARRRSTSRS